MIPKRNSISSFPSPLSKRRRIVKDTNEDDTSYFSILPVEVLTHIFSLTELTALARCNVVCHLWNSIITLDFFKKHFYDNFFGDGSKEKRESLYKRDIFKINFVWRGALEISKVIALFWAIGEGHTNAALHLLKNKTFTLEELELGEPYSKTKVMALDLACYRNTSVELVTTLLSKGAKVSELSLEIAFRCGSAKITNLLLDKADENLREGLLDRISTAAHIGAMGDTKLFDRLLGFNPNSDQTEWISITFLAAIENRETELLMHIFTTRTFPIVPSHLTQAIRSGYRSLIKPLIERNPQIFESENHSLYVNECAKSGTPDVLRELLSCGMDVEDESFDMAFCEAAVTGNVEMIRVFLEMGMEPTSIDFEGDTPLHIAIHNSHVEAVKLLLPRSDKNKKSGARLLPLEHAVRHGNMAIVKLIIADPRPLVQGCVLMLAATFDKFDMIELFLKNGFDPNPSYDSPLKVVLSSNSSPRKYKIAQMLIDAGANVNYPNMLFQLFSRSDPAVGFLLSHGADVSPLLHHLSTRHKLLSELRWRGLSCAGTVEEKQNRLIEQCKKSYDNLAHLFNTNEST